MKGKRTKVMLATLTLLTMLCMNANAATSANTATSSSPTTTDTPATNMVVDFTTMVLPSSVEPGDSRVLNLVIKNTGGYKAENIQVYIPSTGTVRMDKRFYVGRLDPGQSETLPLIFAATNTARTGLTAIQVQISFDGFKSDGSADNNQLTNWEIPLTIEGNPLFQVTVDKSTFYRGSLDNIDINVFAKDRAEDIEATLSSNCLTVMSSTRIHVGSVKANESFSLSYPIKPSVNGACISSLLISHTNEDGVKATDNVTLGSNVENPSVDFKVVTSELPPGKQSDLNVTLHNAGDLPLRNIKFSWTTDKSVILPLGSDNIKHVKFIDVNGNVELSYSIVVDSNAEPGLYKLQLMLAYDDAALNEENSSILTTDAGVYVGGGTEFSVAFSESTKGETSFSVANTGSNPAYSVEISIPKQAGWTVNGSSSTIVGNLNKGDYTTATFRLAPQKTTGESPLQVQIDYTDTSGNRQMVNKQMVMDTSMVTTATDPTKTNGNGLISMPVIAVAVIAITLAVIAYKRNRKKKTPPTHNEAV